MLILILMGWGIWLAISSFSRGPAGAYGYSEDDEEVPSIVPDPPLAQGMINGSPLHWVLFLLGAILFMCWFTS